jgi:hypothetical protein
LLTGAKTVTIDERTKGIRRRRCKRWHARYKAYDAYAKDGDAAAARKAIGDIFGHGEKTSTTHPTYADYYGGGYDAKAPPKK